MKEEQSDPDDAFGISGSVNAASSGRVSASLRVGVPQFGVTFGTSNTSLTNVGVSGGYGINKYLAVNWPVSGSVGSLYGCGTAPGHE
jgi:hypothetical protein